MKLIVTRPAAQAAALLGPLQALGVQAAALPLVEIAPAPDPAAVRAAWAALPGCALAMFVSANAVAQFFALRPQAAAGGAEAAAPWPRGVQAAAPGPGTAAALRQAGVPQAALVQPPREGGRFDSEALWALLGSQPWAGRRVLVVRGTGEHDAGPSGQGRDWLARQLRAAGATVDVVVAYRRLAPRPDAAGRQLLRQALADPAGHAWLFGSAEAVQRLQGLALQARQAQGVQPALHAAGVQQTRQAQQARAQPGAPAARPVNAAADAPAHAAASAPMDAAFNAQMNAAAGVPAGTAAGAPAGAPAVVPSQAPQPAASLFAPALALVPHERIAAAARAAGFGRVRLCAPGAAEVAAAMAAEAAAATGGAAGPVAGTAATGTPAVGTLAGGGGRIEPAGPAGATRSAP